MSHNEANEFNTFLKPEKPFVLISQLENGNQMVTWHEDEEDLIWTAKNNKAVTPIYAFEIGSSRKIKI